MFAELQIGEAFTQADIKSESDPESVRAVFGTFADELSKIVEQQK
jgi:hypothetical protein